MYSLYRASFSLGYSNNAFFGLAAMLMQEYMTQDPVLILLPLLATLGGGTIHHNT